VCIGTHPLTKEGKQKMKVVSGVLLISLALVSLQSLGGARKSDSYDTTTKDAWITGKIETLFTLNRHLNAFSIDTDVDKGMVSLTGVVESDIDRDLAVELAKGVEGVVAVKSTLTIEPKTARQTANANAVKHDGDRTFGTWVDDATTTAAVKSKLVGNSNVQGIKIDVDTRGDVVTLSGRVASSEEKQLAEEIARNTGDVSDVRNQLVVDAAAR
jgi:osmotically-inducible protein OsmY